MRTPPSQDTWIAVKLPGEYQGDDDLEDGTAIRRWITVVLHPDELGWLRETLAAAAPSRRLRRANDLTHYRGRVCVPKGWTAHPAWPPATNRTDPVTLTCNLSPTAAAGALPGHRA